jgi:AraC-like DNA-binding protein
MRKKTEAPIERIEENTWLSDVREVRHPIDVAHPLVVHYVNIKSGPPLPQPSVPFPEKHPYCEVSFHFQGKLTQFIGAEKVERSAGNLMLMGPGTPHYAMYLSYPQRSVAIHFLPMLLFEMGPAGDGARMLTRFTTPRKISERVILPPAKLKRELSWRFEQMAKEFEDRKIGSEFRLWALLMESLVDILRWEESSGFRVEGKTMTLNWTHVEDALRYIHDHYSEPLYLEEIAGAVRLSASRLKATFREALGMSCMHYVRALRISRAKALLCVPGAHIAETAYAVGFDSLGHFNASFRNLVGMSPTEYMRSYHRNRSDRVH